MTIVVADATCLERNLNLILQTLEITGRMVVCLNLMDQAKRNGVHIDTKKLSSLLGVPVVETTARSGKGLKNLMEEVAFLCRSQEERQGYQVRYDEKNRAGGKHLAALPRRAAQRKAQRPLAGAAPAGRG